MPKVSWLPYPRRSLTRRETRPYWSEMRDSTADTDPLAGSMLAVETYTGRLPSPASENGDDPLKFASMVPGWERSYEDSPATCSSRLCQLVFQSSDARHECGTS